MVILVFAPGLAILIIKVPDEGFGNTGLVFVPVTAATPDVHLAASRITTGKEVVVVPQTFVLL
jgi:hypothetical protein